MFMLILYLISRGMPFQIFQVGWVGGSRGVTVSPWCLPLCHHRYLDRRNAIGKILNITKYTIYRLSDDVCDNVPWRPGLSRINQEAGHTCYVATGCPCLLWTWQSYRLPLEDSTTPNFDKKGQLTSTPDRMCHFLWRVGGGHALNSYHVKTPRSGFLTVAQKGHRYFSTIVCIFPAYYNFLKKHFDFSSISSISTRVESISTRCISTRVEILSTLLSTRVEILSTRVESHVIPIGHLSMSRDITRFRVFGTRRR